ncbi:hypothetical protein [Rhizobium herbae]|uniref:Uncharacterized protein n=1 Tax=Rhizobium herbae TaxID=508661 RepID=A0ABS4EVR7_9HYPH|nr:hypothetical protein [Rhizobium herbae]MBP1862022.1 hypothetical protein [Rhizobium herbae]
MIAQPLDSWKYTNGSSEDDDVSRWNIRAVVAAGSANPTLIIMLPAWRSVTAIATSPGKPAAAVPQCVVKTPGAANV